MKCMAKTKYYIIGEKHGLECYNNCTCIVKTALLLRGWHEMTYYQKTEFLAGARMRYNEEMDKDITLQLK
jgi:hypothetical protein